MSEQRPIRIRWINEYHGRLSPVCHETLEEAIEAAEITGRTDSKQIKFIEGSEK